VAAPSSMTDSAQVACLEASEEYAALNRKSLFIKKYGHVMAIGPFFVVICVVFRWFSDSTSKFLLGLIFSTLFWAVAFACFAVIVFASLLFIRCPRCGWRFGLGDFCSSCGLPRSCNTL
jgi:hypothetical protein